MVCFNGLLQWSGSRMKTEENLRKPKENTGGPGPPLVFLRFSYFSDFGVHSGRESLRNGPAGSLRAPPARIPDSPSPISTKASWPEIWRIWSPSLFNFINFFNFISFFKFSLGFSYFLDLGIHSGKESLRNGPAGVSGLLQPESQIAPVQSPPRPAGLRSGESQAQIF